MVLNMAEKPKMNENDANTPVMTYGQMLEGQSLMKKFLKKIEIRIKKEKVITSYIWEFPDEAVAKIFADQMKTAFEGQLNT
jgi:hypothetical protein